MIKEISHQGNLMKLIRILMLLLLAASWSRAQNFSDIFYFSEDTVGYKPILHLVQGPNGVLYGETFNGQGSSFGTVLAVNTNGTVFTNLYNFSGNDGSEPQADLVLSSNILYGSTYGGGTHGDGIL